MNRETLLHEDGLVHALQPRVCAERPDSPNYAPTALSDGLRLQTDISGSAWDSEVGFYTDPIYANVGGRQHGSAALAGLRLITTF